MTEDYRQLIKERERLMKLLIRRQAKTQRYQAELAAVDLQIATHHLIGDSETKEAL